MVGIHTRVYDPVKRKKRFFHEKFHKVTRIGPSVWGEACPFEEHSEANWTIVEGAWWVRGEVNNT